MRINKCSFSEKMNKTSEIRCKSSSTINRGMEVIDVIEAFSLDSYLGKHKYILKSRNQNATRHKAIWYLNLFEKNK